MEYWTLVVLDVFVVGLPLLFRLARPIEMNALYGYRTKRSKLSKHTWKAANKYSGNLMVFGSALVLFFQLTLVAMGKTIPTVVVGSAIFWISTLITGVYLTESYLKKNFDAQGNKL